MQRSALPGEANVAQWGEFTLSTHRVWVVKNREGTNGLHSIPIDAVQSVGIERQHTPLLLGIAALLMLMALIAALSDSHLVGAAFGIALLATGFAALYFWTRKVIVAIHAGPSVLATGIDGSQANVDAAMRFLDAVEAQGLAVRRASDAMSGGRGSGLFATS